MYEFIIMVLIIIMTICFIVSVGVMMDYYIMYYYKERKALKEFNERQEMYKRRI